MPKPEKFLIQIRLSAADRRRIKSLAAKQDLTLQKAVVVAFQAWAEKLRSPDPDRDRAQSVLPNPPSPSNSERSWEWLKQAVRVDWAQCPEAERLEEGVHELWVIRESDAPLFQVLRAVADGLPLSEVAEIYAVELPQLTKILDFVEAGQVSDALN